MRIAVIADIHGNRLALDAVLGHIEARGGADLLVNLGDCASGPLWPRETMERLDALGAVTVRGNHDRWVATLAPAEMNASDRFAHGALTPEQREWLGALPTIATIAPGVLAFHARPSRDDAYLLDDIDGGRLVRASLPTVESRLGEPWTATVALCGHSHRADMVRLPGGCLVINPGSVGGPAYRDPTQPPHVSEAGTPHARYAMLTLGGAGQGDPSVEFLAIPYAHEEAARCAEANGRPDWAHALRTGRLPA